MKATIKKNYEPKGSWDMSLLSRLESYLISADSLNWASMTRNIVEEINQEEQPGMFRKSYYKLHNKYFSTGTVIEIYKKSDLKEDKLFLTVTYE